MKCDVIMPKIVACSTHSEEQNIWLLIGSINAIAIHREGIWPDTGLSANLIDQIRISESSRISGRIYDTWLLLYNKSCTQL